MSGLLIGLAGRARSGKDTVAGRLAEGYGLQRMALERMDICFIHDIDVFTRGAEIVGWLGRTILLVIRGEVREPWNLRGDTHRTHLERGEAGGEREVLRRGRLRIIVALVLVGERG